MKNGQPYLAVQIATDFMTHTCITIKKKVPIRTASGPWTGAGHGCD